MESGSLRPFEQVRAHMADLLAIKRFCALVVPIKHEIKAKTTKDAKKERAQRQPTGQYLVRLFEGGGISLRKGEAEGITASINAQLAALVREAQAPHREALVRIAKRPPGIESLRALDDGLKGLQAAESFMVLSGSALDGRDFGDYIQPRSPHEGYVYFDGSEAKERSEAFCVAVNQVLTSAFAKREAELTQALADAVSSL